SEFSACVTASGPTALALNSFTATEYDEGVLLEWQTGFETDNLGFRLYRDHGGKLAPITQQLVAGSALQTSAQLRSGAAYLWWDKEVANCGADCQKPAYWLEDIDLSGKSSWHGPFYVEKAKGGRQKTVNSKQSAEDHSALLREITAEESATGTSTVVERKATPVAVKQVAQLAPVTVNLQSAVKISIAREGWYRISAAELFTAGLPQNDDPQMLQLFVDGREVPIAISN